MITRVADQMKFNLLNNSISNIQNDNNELMVKLSTQKKVNEPSDDPIGMGKILDYRSAKAQISNYQKNVDSSKSWLSTTESNLTSVNDILTQVKETVMSQSSATATASTRQIAADSLQPLIDQVLSLANAKLGNSYIFSGSMTDTEPFSATAQAARIDAPVKASGDAFDGGVTSGGAYTGTANKTYVVKIITGGTLAASTYQISTDGGKTFGAAQSDLSAPVTIGDGIQLTFTAGTTDFAANDVVYVHACAAGYYNGNGEALASEVGKDVTINYNTTGEAAFTNQGQGTADIFQTLNDLKTALENNDATGIANQLDPLSKAQDQVNRYIGQCGTRTNSLDTSSSTLTDMDTRITGLTSNIEDADMAQLITEYQNKQLALQASYQMASNLTSNSILNFIR
ncbi:MAG: flagellar hook-associated protein FlgL [Syntrophales bacterium]